jgi:hypothetical protein
MSYWMDSECGSRLFGWDSGPILNVPIPTAGRPAAIAARTGLLMIQSSKIHMRTGPALSKPLLLAATSPSSDS